MLLNPKLKTVILTGAGISADSGIATFRDPQDGLWSEYSPEDLATTKAFDKNPSLVLDWYEWRRRKVLDAEPSSGHKALVNWQSRFQNLTLVTQNVDGLHQKAGSTALEMHGSIHRMKCRQHNHKIDRWIDMENGKPPVCGECTSLMRPDIVWFNEHLDRHLLNRIYKALEDCEVFLAIGTSGIVYPAAEFVELAKQNKARTICVNIAKDESPYFDENWCGRAADILPKVEIEI